MSYRKILVDNTTCSRRFHIAFDDEDPKQPLVEVQCLHCKATVFSKQNHPIVKLARDENLVKTDELSPNRTKECWFKDSYPPKIQKVGTRSKAT